MQQRCWLWCVFAVVISLLHVVCDGGRGGSASSKRPNIIIIIADDMGYGDLGVYGSPSIRTPNLDKMAQEGIKFTSMYTAQPICTPARAALLTGRLPIRNGMYQNVTTNCMDASGMSSVLWWNSLGGLPNTEVTMPQLLQNNGYTTALVGKWHVGIGRNFEYLPTRKGFQHFYGIPLWHMNPENENKIPDVPLMSNETIIGRLYSSIQTENLTLMYVDYMQQFLREYKNGPFFLMYAPDNTHQPVYYSDLFTNSQRGDYGNAVEEMDWSVGQVLAQLKALGIDDDTFVFWSNDNGPALYLHAGNTDWENWAQAGSAGPLFGGKGTTWEGGIRVPAIARWPNRIPPNAVTSEMSSLMDIFPTVMEITNTPLPKNLILDGKSMTDILFYKNGTTLHEYLYHWRGDTLYAVSHGNFKAHFWTQGAEMYTQPPITKHDPPLLFNVKVDPAESKLIKPGDGHYAQEIATISLAAKLHVLSFVPPTPQFNWCDNAAGMWLPDLPVPPSHVVCCEGGGN